MKAPELFHGGSQLFQNQNYFESPHRTQGPQRTQSRLPRKPWSNTCGYFQNRLLKQSNFIQGRKRFCTYWILKGLKVVQVRTFLSILKKKKKNRIFH